MENKIEQIYKTILKFEDPEISDQKKIEVMNWFRQISDPQFALVDGLIQMFIDKVDNPQIEMKIMKVLRKLNEHLPDTVGPQFFNNQKFPEAIVRYLEHTKLEELAGDAFLLLINVFDETTTPELISDNFVKKLTSSLEYISDESTLHSLISILACLCPHYEKKSPDPSNIELNPIL